MPSINSSLQKKFKIWTFFSSNNFSRPEDQNKKILSLMVLWTTPIIVIFILNYLPNRFLMKSANFKNNFKIFTIYIKKIWFLLHFDSNFVYFSLIKSFVSLLCFLQKNWFFCDSGCWKFLELRLDFYWENFCRNFPNRNDFFAEKKIFSTIFLL